MRWSLFSIVSLAALVIMWLEWSNFKKKPIGDRSVLVSLLLIVWIMSMLDLRHIPGPPSFLQFIFKPLRGLIEQ